MDDKKDPAFVYRRAELMVRLFLEELEPTSIVQVGDKDKSGLDFLITFVAADEGLRVVGVQLKATQLPVKSTFQFGVRREWLAALRHSNVPILLLVADVKQNKLYFAWLDKISKGIIGSGSGRNQLRVNLTPAEGQQDSIRKHVLEDVR